MKTCCPITWLACLHASQLWRQWKLRLRLLHDNTVHNQTNLKPNQICELLDLGLITTYFQYNGRLVFQYTPVYMEEVESSALNSSKGTAPSHWLRYVDKTLMKIKTQEAQGYNVHINSVDRNIKLTREDVSNNSLPFLECWRRQEPHNWSN